MKNRAFGVEIECCGPSLDVEDYVTHTYELLRENGFRWDTSYDDSLDESGVEVKSPILRGEEGIKDIHSVVSLLNREGYYVDNSCGLHVHHDAPEFLNNKVLVNRFIRSWMNNQQHIAALVSSERHENDYSELWYEEDVQEVFYQWETWGEMGHSKRGAFNLGSLLSHGSIEIRLHEGTLNANEIEHWIKLGNNLVDHIANAKGIIGKHSDPIRFLKRIGVEKNTIGYFSHRYTKE